MLKGIIFILLIIITFDIGKYFIDKKRNIPSENKDTKIAKEVIEQAVEEDDIVVLREIKEFSEMLGDHNHNVRVDKEGDQ